MHGNIHTLKFKYTALETRKYDIENYRDGKIFFFMGAISHQESRRQNT